MRFLRYNVYNNNNCYSKGSYQKKKKHNRTTIIVTCPAGGGLKIGESELSTKRCILTKLSPHFAEANPLMASFTNKANLGLQL